MNYGYDQFAEFARPFFAFQERNGFSHMAYYDGNGYQAGPTSSSLITHFQEELDTNMHSQLPSVLLPE
jgi:hypothetical protein